MKDYTNKIEKYLRGQMNHEEEMNFKNKIRAKGVICSQTFLVTLLIKHLGKAHKMPII